MFDATVTLGLDEPIGFTLASTYNRIAGGLQAIVQSALGDGVTVYVKSITGQVVVSDAPSLSAP